MGRPFTTPVRVRYSDCDPQGVLFFGNYLAYLDIAMTELWREAIGPYQAMVSSGVDLVVAEASLRYLAPARFDDVIDISVLITRLGTTGMTSELELSREGELLCEGMLRHVFIEAASHDKAPMPDDVRAGLEPYVTPEAGGS